MKVRGHVHFLRGAWGGRLLHTRSRAALWAARRLAVRDERGDVPGWVMITVVKGARNK